MHSYIARLYSFQDQVRKLIGLARVLCSATREDWKLVRWINPPDPEDFIGQLYQLGQNLIFPE
jgi:hypothetical protein